MLGYEFLNVCIREPILLFLSLLSSNLWASCKETVRFS